MTWQCWILNLCGHTGARNVFFPIHFIDPGTFKISCVLPSCNHSFVFASTPGISTVLAVDGLCSISTLYDKAGYLKTCSVIITASRLCFSNALQILLACLIVHNFSGSRRKKFGWKCVSIRIIRYTFLIFFFKSTAKDMDTA